MYVVAGASGNTGKVVADTLLGQGKAVRVIVRDEKKGEAWKARGAQVAVAELDDAEALTIALREAEGAYLLLPPSYGSTHVRADNARRAQAMAKAVDASGVDHVVLLSSIGAQHADGTGPIASVHDAEDAFGKTRAGVTSLRAAYFMENWGNSLYALAQGKLPTFLVAGRAIPMVATADIGATAAGLLVEGGRSKRVVELAGPREYSPNDVATALSRVAGRPVVVEQGPEEAMPAALTAAGLTPEWARLFQEMTHAVNAGLVDWEAGRPRVRGVTEVDVVLRKLLARS
jgi:uncharacterized protein YbjT (DUF2867 family)